MSKNVIKRFLAAEFVVRMEQNVSNAILRLTAWMRVVASEDVTFGRDSFPNLTSVKTVQLFKGGIPKMAQNVQFRGVLISEKLDKKEEGCAYNVLIT